jgi:hypothetical protein
MSDNPDWVFYSDDRQTEADIKRLIRETPSDSRRLAEAAGGAVNAGQVQKVPADCSRDWSLA